MSKKYQQQVEDEEMLRKMVATMLILLGYQVLAAKDGVEALKIFKNCHDEIHMVIVDPNIRTVV